MRKFLLSVLAAGVMLAGCGNDNGNENRNAAPTTTEPTVTGNVSVFAATSLTNAFTEIGKAFEASNPDAKVVFNFAASSALVQQLNEGATADVIAAADTATTDKLASLIDTPTTFAKNKLVIVTKPGNPKKVKGLSDLPRLGVVSLCGAEVPCGKYAAEALGKAKVTIDESKVTRGQNVAATLAAVAEGDADAAIVYVTDVTAKVEAVDIAAAQNVDATYPIATLKAAPNSWGARSFAKFVSSAAGQKILQKFGFLAS